MTEAHDQVIAGRLATVQQRIAAAASRVGRDSQEITLVAVTKTWPTETIVSAYQAGIRHIGENRAEELAQKKAELKESFAPAGELVWHQIGTLQSRKTKLTAEFADVFHALDRLKVANRLSMQLEEFGRSLPVLLEVNLSGEASKSGFPANNWEESATQRRDLRRIVESVSRLPGLQLQGMMTMAPWDADEQIVRSVFRRTRLLRDWLQDAMPQVALTQLSMGMTDDFEIAIEEGATMVRVGRAIFGDRY